MRRLTLRAALACAALLGAALPAPAATPPEPTVTVVLDSDSANEIDDLYAITRALLSPKLRVVALSSAQWHNRVSPEDTVIDPSASWLALGTQTLRAP